MTPCQSSSKGGIALYKERIPADFPDSPDFSGSPDSPDAQAAALREIPVREIAPPEPLPPDPSRPPEHSPDAERLRALAESIRLRGVRIPLVVSPLPHPMDPHAHAQPDGPFRYSILAGERRFAAARLAGLPRVPCAVVGSEPDPADPVSAGSAVSAVAENLRAGDLTLFESASAVAALIALTGFTQEQCASRLGVSQSFVANKLRLLRLTEDERRLMLAGRLTERHGRALLRFPTPEERAPVLDAMIRREMNVAAAEEYVESLLCADARAAVRRSLSDREPSSPSAARPLPPDRRLIQRESRRFTDSIEKAVDVVRRSGIPVEARRKETPAGLLISILVPKSS